MLLALDAWCSFFNHVYALRQFENELMLKSVFIYDTLSVVRLSSEHAPHCGGADKGRVMGITQALPLLSGAVFLSVPSDLYLGQSFGQWLVVSGSPA